MITRYWDRSNNDPYEPSPSPYPYRPLQGDEIRLLTIDPISPKENPISNISYTLHHVNLTDSQGPGVAGSVSHSCYTRDWPELRTAPDTSRLFKNAAWAKKQVLSKYERIDHESLDRENEGHVSGQERQISWRHSWGDYVALSYVWGPQTPAETILLDGVPFPVGPNLYLALRELCRSQKIRQGFMVWIDAICINQQDMTERNRQVVRMRDIYGSAWQVVSWLGGEQDDSDLAIDALRFISRLSAAGPIDIDDLYRVKRGMDARPLFIAWDTFESPFRKEVFRALLGFFRRPYWRRMWIMQEVAMAHPESPVLCGGKCLSWTELHNAASLIASDEERFGHLVAGTLMFRWDFEIGQARLSKKRYLSPERLWRLIIDLLRVQGDQKDAPLSDNTADELRPLRLARDAAVTDERDRVYGMLGIKAVAERVSIVPDYTLSPSINFHIFASAILKGGNLNFLRLVSLLDKPIHTKGSLRALGSKGSLRTLGSKVLEAAPCVHNLPSWVVCWTCDTLPAAHLRTTYRAGKTGTAAQPSIILSNSCLRIRGLVIDIIVSLGTCHPAEASNDYPIRSLKSGHRLLGGYMEMREALWRTITGNSTVQGDSPAPAEYSWLLDPRVWRGDVAGIFTHGLGLNEVMRRNGGLNLCGFSLKELIFGRGRTKRPWTGDYYNPTKTQREALSCVVDVLTWRRLMSTRSGRLGLAPAGAVLGDAIAIFQGCDVPMVIRRRGVGSGWRLVGEAYVHGIMDGEIYRQGFTPSDIDIY